MRSLLLLVVFSLIPSTIVSAQATAAGFSLRGKVLDSIGAPLAGAHVTAVPDGQGQPASAATDNAGDFALMLQPGSYTVTVSADGFRENAQRIKALNVGADTREFILPLATLRESVSVTAPTGYQVGAVSSATKTLTPLTDVPQSVTVVTKELIKDQLMMSVGDVVRYVPGITAHQGENNRDQVIIRGNNSSADFFVNGVRDDVQYFRDLYNLDRVEALKGPNAMIFGRGGGGGVVNRVVKEAEFRPIREFTVQVGGYGHKRIAADLDQPLTGTIAVRLNAMFENSGSFRRAVDLQRAGINPTLTYSPSGRTKITVGYEYLRDTRVADRGITSFQGRPAAVAASTFYGNPAESQVRARVNLGSALFEHRAGSMTFRNRTLIGSYDRFYQNFVPGATSADRTSVALTAYNNATNRMNVFNQTDLTLVGATGRIRHTLLVGAEVGRQATDNFRNSGFFNNVAGAIQVPFDSPTINTPVIFRQNGTDADNHVRTNVAAAFAQDQVALSPRVLMIGGVRLDRFDLRYHNNRIGATLGRLDTLVSPRAGMVLKPILPLSIYGTYSVSYLPSSGDQFSSLTTVTQQVKPERFNNYEVGAKWDLLAGLSLTTAAYRLDRTNTRSTDPNDPTRIIQTGSQRTNGYELGINGQLTPAWRIAGGYAYQDAFVASATISARAGAQAGQVPHHTLSLWNNYRVHRRLGVGMGIVHRSDMFAAIDNTVTLPGYTEADAAAYFRIRQHLSLQANLENVFNARYVRNADGNTNISPGFPRTLRIGLTAAF
ncbi:MAG: TonB-dependent siderophore receptor [Vicinamibacterales bacterium]